MEVGAGVVRKKCGLNALRKAGFSAIDLEVAVAFEYFYEREIQKLQKAVLSILRRRRFEVRRG
jgi:hypothetical protein